MALSFFIHIVIIYVFFISLHSKWSSCTFFAYLYLSHLSFDKKTYINDYNVTQKTIPRSNNNTEQHNTQRNKNNIATQHNNDEQQHMAEVIIKINKKNKQHESYFKHQNPQLSMCVIRTTTSILS